MMDLFIMFTQLFRVHTMNAFCYLSVAFSGFFYYKYFIQPGRAAKYSTN